MPAQLYVTRELSFVNGQTTLAGTLYLPNGAGPFPGVVLLHGSGPDTRVPYRSDARMFAEAGIAALIYDKRGTGESTGNWQTASLHELAADALVAARRLREQSEIQADKVGLWGVSQGGWLSPLAAPRDPQLAFIVQVTSAAMPLANQEMWGVGNELRGLGFSDGAIRTAMKGMHLFFSLRPLVQRGIIPLGDLWFIAYDPYLDPVEEWHDIDMPALLLFGARDGTVPSSDSMHRLTPLLAAQSHDKSRMYLFPEKGHSLGGTKKSEDPVYVRIVTEWIHAVLNDQPIPHVDLPAAADDPALRWYGNAAQQTPWYSTAAVQLPLILLFGFIFLAGAVASLLPQFTLAATNSSWLPKLILGLTCILNLLLLGGTGFVINYLLSADQMSAGPDIPLRIYLFIGALVSTLLAGALCYVGIAAYRRQTAHTISLVTWGFVTLTSIAFVLFLRYWGVLGMPL